MIEFKNLQHPSLKARIVFVNVSRSCKNLTDVYEIKEMARGRWAIDKNKQTDDNRPQILVAVRRAEIIGVYHITGFHTGTDTYNFPIGQFDKRENNRRRMELRCLEKIRAGEYPTGFSDIYEKFYGKCGKDMQEQFDWWLHLYYFDCGPLETFPNEAVKQQLQNCKGQILFKDGKPFKFHLNNCYYNY